MTRCSGCGERFDRSRGYSGSVINPYCRSKRCEAPYLKNADAMAAAPLNLQMPFHVVNGFDNEHYAQGQRRLKA